MTRPPNIVARLLGSWKIVEMELWDQDYVDLVVPGFIRFDDEHMGEFQFGVVAGALDFREEVRDGAPCVEWSWEGEDEGDPRCGRGWAQVEGDRLVGKIYFHRGDDSTFVATRSPTRLAVEVRPPAPSRRPRRRRP